MRCSRSMSIVSASFRGRCSSALLSRRVLIGNFNRSSCGPSFSTQHHHVGVWQRHYALHLHLEPDDALRRHLVITLDNLSFCGCHHAFAFRTKNGQNLTIAKNPKYAGGTIENLPLVIQNVSREDMGEYSCTCKNEVGSTESDETIYLNVECTKNQSLFALYFAPSALSAMSSTFIFQIRPASR